MMMMRWMVLLRPPTEGRGGLLSWECATPEGPIARALSGRLKFTVRRHKFNEILARESRMLEDARCTWGGAIAEPGILGIPDMDTDGFPCGS